MPSRGQHESSRDATVRESTGWSLEKARWSAACAAAAPSLYRSIIGPYQMRKPVDGGQFAPGTAKIM